MANADKLGPDRIIEKTVSTGIFTRTTSLATGPHSQRKLMREVARRVNEDPVEASAPLEQHAVLLVRKHGNGVVSVPTGYKVVAGDALSMAATIKKFGDRALGPIVPAGAINVSDPMGEDARTVLAEMMAIRVALESGHTPSLIRAAVRLGQAATRLKVRPFEDEARIGREFVQSQRERARKRYQGQTDDKNVARVAAFERFKRAGLTTEQSLLDAAEVCGCKRTSVRNAVKAAGKLPPSKPTART